MTLELEGEVPPSETQAACTIDPDAAMLLLGDTGLTILRAIDMGARDTWSIHIWTGLPVRCIEGRLGLLDQFDIMKASRDGMLSLTVLGGKLAKRPGYFS